MSDMESEDIVTEPDMIDWSPRHGPLIGSGGPPAIDPPKPASSLALAVGAAAFGAFAIGALAIGALAIGRLTVGRARFKDLRIDRLVVDELIVRRQRRV